MTIKKYAGDKVTGLVSDTKPTNMPDGATFYELDSGKVYRLYSATWTEIENTKANNALITAAAAFNQANAAPGIANTYATAVGAAGNTYASSVGVGANAYATSVGTSANSYATVVGASANARANTVGTSSNSYATLVGTSGNAYALSVATSIGTAGNTFASSVGVSANTYATSVGTSGNAYTTLVGASSNAWTNSTATTVGTSANNFAGVMANSANGFAITVGASANARANVVGTSANAFATSVGTSGNSYATAVGTSGNAYALSIATSIGTAGNVYAASVGVGANSYATSVGTSANAYAASITGPAFNLANTANAVAVYAANFANSINVIAVNAYNTANAAAAGTNDLYARTTANDAYVTAQSAFTQANAAPSIANSYATSVGAAGNSYATAVGTSANNYSTSVGAAGNTYTLAAFNKANASVQYTTEGTYTAGAKQTFTPNTTLAGINLGTFAGNPSSAVNGDVVFNSSSNRFTGYVSGWRTFAQYELSGTFSGALTYTGTQTMNAATTFNANASFNIATFSAKAQFSNGFNIVGRAGDSLGVSNGDVWFNSTTGKLSWRQDNINYLFASNADVTLIGTSANAYATSVGTSSNTFASSVGVGANAYATTVGTSGNAYALSIATSIGTSGNSYATAIGTSGNAYALATATAIGTSGNVYAASVGVSANSYATSVGASSNGYATLVGASANGWANTKVSSSGGTITGDLAITGNLNVSGNTSFISVQNFRVDDPLIYLAANNYVSDIVDIGFIGNYVNATGANVHTGLYREHEDKMYYLFQGYDREPANNHIGALSNNMTLAVLNADIRTSNLVLFGANAQQFIISSFAQANTALTTAGAAFNKANATTYTSNVVIEVADNTNAALRITQTGIGEAFRVEDSTNPDATPFVIDANGDVTIGTTTISNTKLVVSHATAGKTLLYAAGPGAAFYLDNNGTGNSFLGSNTFIFRNARATLEYTRIDTSGNVLIGRTTSTVGQNVKLDVAGGVNSSILLVNGVEVTSIANSYATSVGTSGNAYASSVGVGANTYTLAAFNQANNANITAGSAFAKANAALANTTGTVFNGEFNIGGGGKLTVLPVGGDEGGEILLAKPPNGTLDGGITIDTYQNRLRIFEQGGSARGVYIDLASAGAGVSTDLLNPASTPDNVARTTASAAFGQANLALATAQSAFTTANAGGGSGPAFTQANLALATAQSAFTQANAAPGIANSYATSVGASANNWANTKLANTSGVSFSGDLTITGNVGIGTAHSSNFRLEVGGAFAATTKSFVIVHPTKENMSLRYGSLEGPENGVYVRGIATSDVIDLPDYWSSLVDESTVTVNLTGINSKAPSVNRVENNKVYLNKPLFSKIHCYYTVFAERKDVDKLIVEY